MSFLESCVSRIKSLSDEERDILFAKIYYRQLWKNTKWSIYEDNIGKILYEYASNYGILNIDRVDYNDFNYFCDSPGELSKIYTVGNWNIGYSFMVYDIKPNNRKLNLEFFKETKIPLNQKYWPYQQLLKDAVDEIEKIFVKAKVQFASGIKDNQYMIYFVKFYDGNFKKFLGKNYENQSNFDRFLNKLIPKKLIIKYQKYIINKGLQEIAKKYYKIINELFANCCKDLDFVNGNILNINIIKSKYEE